MQVAGKVWTELANQVAGKVWTAPQKAKKNTEEFIFLQLLIIIKEEIFINKL